MSVSVTFVGWSRGRFNTCILVDAPRIRFCIDFGASSLIALERLGVSHNTIDAILLTHLHGDHCGGIPFLLVDAMLAVNRDRPLTIAGPRDTSERLKAVAVAVAMMPGMDVMVPKFPITYLDLPVFCAARQGHYVSCHPYTSNQSYIHARRGCRQGHCLHG